MGTERKETLREEDKHIPKTAKPEKHTRGDSHHFQHASSLLTQAPQSNGKQRRQQVIHRGEM